MRLENRDAIVTGGSSGIGREIALTFAREGANVAIGDVREEPKDEGARPTAEEIRDMDRDQDAVFVQTDVADQDDCRELVDTAVDRFGGLDILVNNAGVFPTELREKSIEEIEEEDWDRVIDINLKGHYNCAKFAVPHVRESDAGRIVNMSSLMGMIGTKEALPYSSSKGGILGLTHQLAAEYAEDAVTVNAIVPGVIITGTWEYREDKPDYGRASTPLPYLGKPEDIASAALFFAADSGRFVTGQRLIVDGGYARISTSHTGAED